MLLGCDHFQVRETRVPWSQLLYNHLVGWGLVVCVGVVRVWTISAALTRIRVSLEAVHGPVMSPHIIHRLRVWVMLRVRITGASHTTKLLLKSLPLCLSRMIKAMSASIRLCQAISGRLRIWGKTVAKFLML